jgi:hypothetical protein
MNGASMPEIGWKNPSDPVAGGLYVCCSQKPYGVLKVLKVEDQIVHIRLYTNRFDRIPPRVEPKILDLGTIHDSDGFRIGHLPISHETFTSWRPQFLQHALVEPDELDRYQISKDSRGSVWEE